MFHVRLSTSVVDCDTNLFYFRISLPLLWTVTPICFMFEYLPLLWTVYLYVFCILRCIFYLYFSFLNCTHQSHTWLAYVPSTYTDTNIHTPIRTHARTYGGTHCTLFWRPYYMPLTVPSLENFKSCLCICFHVLHWYIRCCWCVQLQIVLSNHFIGRLLNKLLTLLLVSMRSSW